VTEIKLLVPKLRLGTSVKLAPDILTLLVLIELSYLCEKVQHLMAQDLLLILIPIIIYNLVFYDEEKWTPWLANTVTGILVVLIAITTWFMLNHRSN
jgi:hypothetical protein